MRKEKTLDEALDEMDKWGDHVASVIRSLTPKQLREYFRTAQADLERETGIKLNLRVRRAPRSKAAPRPLGDLNE